MDSLFLKGRFCFPICAEHFVEVGLSRSGRDIVKSTHWQHVVSGLFKTPTIGCFMYIQCGLLSIEFLWGQWCMITGGFKIWKIVSNSIVFKALCEFLVYFFVGLHSFLTGIFLKMWVWVWNSAEIRYMLKTNLALTSYFFWKRN